MKKPALLVSVILFLSFFSCASAKSTNAESEIRSALDKQVAAWNRGDLDGFMDGYLQSAKTSYVSGDSEIHGFEAIKERYQKRYGSDTTSMGNLTFSELNILSLDKNSALVTGHFKVTGKNKPDATGVFSVVFVRNNGKWKVIHDHTTASHT